MITKRDLIESGKYNIFLEMKKEFYKNGGKCYDPNSYTSIFTLEEAKECLRIYNNNHTRKRRNNEDIIRWCYAITKLNHWKDYMIIFGTLNFSDKALNSTSKKTRRVMVGRYIGAVADNYIANIDYGAKNGREHYHFIALTKYPFDIHKWKYGGGKFIKVPIVSQDIESIKNYVLGKLNNHTYKESTKLERVIKDKRPLLDQCIDLLYIEDYTRYKLLFLEQDYKKNDA